LQLYLFSDVLVTGTKIRKVMPNVAKSDSDGLSTVVVVTEEGGSQVSVPDDTFLENRHDGEVVTTTVEGSKVEMVVPEPETNTEKIVTEVFVTESLLDNPYAGHLENQRISRLTQVQADIVEGDGKSRSTNKDHING